MTKEQISFDRAAFLNDMRASVAMIAQAEKIGESLALEGIERLLLVGCGAPHYMFHAINMWIGSMTKENRIADIYPAELGHPRYHVDEKTAVIFGSHSGKTAETLLAAQELQGGNSQTLAITERADSALGKSVRQVLDYGPSKQGYFSAVILTLALVSAFLKKHSPTWDVHAALISSLQHLPGALADAKQVSMADGMRHAAALQNEAALFVVGNGPMYTTAYVFAACFLMEMQRMNAHPVDALDFFHGPFELMDASTAIILLKGEGVFRPDDERVEQFCERYLDGCITYDAVSFTMDGIDPLIRPIAAPFIVDAALTNVVEQLAILRGHALDIRRYMGKVDY